MGTSRQHVVQLNGKDYDAVTGKPLVASRETPATVPAKKSPRVMDAIVRTKAHQITAQTLHKTAQHSKTLMRTAVKKKPIIKLEKTHVANQSVTANSAKSAQKYPEIIRSSAAVHTPNVKKSSLISKFGQVNPGLKPHVIPVAPAPSHTIASTKKTLASAPAVAEVESASSLVARGLAKATSHQSPRLHHSTRFSRAAHLLHLRSKTLAIGLSVFVALGVAGFFAYNNMPNLAMRVAATRAGFHASLPNYQPAGFSMQRPIDYDPGQVSVQFKSNSDDRGFKVVQRASAWDSQALLENVVSPKNAMYQTYQANGRTIYIYDNNNATWVDGGVWYQIEGNASLNSDQLLKIANSL